MDYLIVRRQVLLSSALRSHTLDWKEFSSRSTSSLAIRLNRREALYSSYMVCFPSRHPDARVSEVGIAVDRIGYQFTASRLANGDFVNNSG